MDGRATDRWGLLVINLGTPDAPRVPEVRRYLREFLSDPRVLDIGAVKRALILNLFILPFRPRASAEAYSKVWTERGSPLLFHGLDLCAKLRERLGPDIPVELGMRYQNPSIGSALARLREAGIDRIAVFPLFPHNSSSAWGSAVEHLWNQARAAWDVPALSVVPPYYDHPAFIRAFAAIARPVIEEARPDRILLSYHGLPERHCTKSDATGGRHCLQRADCCEALVQANRNCYRAQCFATSRALAAALELADDAWEVAFQSRLGRDPWIRPYTDERITAMPREGVKKVAVLSPAFTADCLETLEELEMRAREDFLAAGGEELRLVPSLNSSEVWVESVLEILRDALSFETASRT